MKEVEQQLREHVKWLATDSDTWLKNLQERLDQLGRISEKSLRFEFLELDVVKKESQGFLEQKDEEIIHIDRPEKTTVIAFPSGLNCSATQGSSPYMLTRYLSESRIRSLSPTGKSLRSMQHFFLQLGVITTAFSSFRQHLVGNCLANRHGFLVISEEGLTKTLQNIGVPVEPDDIEAIFTKYDAPQHMAEEGSTTSSTKTTTKNTITFEQMFTSLPLWDLILVSTFLPPSTFLLIPQG